MRMVRVASDAARVIQKAWLERLTQRKLTAWVAEAQRAATMADNESLRELLRCDPPYERLLPLRRERIPIYGGGGAPLEVVNGLVNIRDPACVSSRCCCCWSLACWCLRLAHALF